MRSEEARFNFGFRLVFSLFAALAALAGEAAAAGEKRPNFVIIVADDLGYSDITSFGGDIPTPNLDRLAAEGVRYTNFYVGPTCSPTRSMLLTGRDSHRIGLGNMYERTAINQLNEVGYEGVLHRNVPTIAERLRAAGYRTYMTGKWHLGHDPDRIPHARGFDRSFSILNGGGSHFDMTGLNHENEKSEFVSDATYVKDLPSDHYSSRSFTDKMISYLKADRADDRPFVAYLAFQAPHDPLQVPDEFLRRFKGAYDKGWDATRADRLKRLIDAGFAPPSAKLPPRLWYVPSYDDLLPAAQAISARRMEIYASVVEYLDGQVGKLVAYLKDSGQLDNTIILFFSDNGPEGADPIPAAQRQPSLESSMFYANNYSTHYAAWGRPYGFMAYGPAWAQVSAVPFNGYKGALYEGGIRSPLIVWQPGGRKGAAVNNDAVLHVMDIAPTLAELGGASVKANDMQGKSWAPMLAGRATSPRTEDDVIAAEFSSARMARAGDWKVTWMPKPFGKGTWELFNLKTDPGETTDLSAQQPKIRARLIAAWEKYAKENNFVMPDRTFYDGLEERLPPRPPVDGDWPRGQEPNWTKEHPEALKEIQ